MADFSRLPNEIISEIWGKVQEPEDVESFALVSKHVYAIGEPFVDEHNKLKKKFSFFKADSLISVSGPAFLLEQVLLRPRIALYVTHLSTGCFSQSWAVSSDEDLSDDDDEQPYNGHVRYPHKAMALFIRTIRRSSFVPKNQTSCWIRSVKEGDEDPIVALLCMLLPNLVVLTLRDNGFDALISQETILRIAEAEKTAFLTRLVTVNFVCRPAYHPMDWNWLRAFAALPSVQSIHFDEMGHVECGKMFGDAQRFVSDSYSIRELAFTNSGFPLKVFFNVLESIKGLKRFSYVDLKAAARQFASFWIPLALLANAKHSLECLTILCPQAQEGVLGTLREFTSLKELKTSVRHLTPGDNCDFLANLLPHSIEKIHLDTRYYWPHPIVPRLVEDIVEAKSRLIPHLKTLKLVTEGSVGVDSITKSLEEKCQNVGIELTFIES